VAVGVLASALAGSPRVLAASSGPGQAPATGGTTSLDDARHHFYSGRYEAAAEAALAIRSVAPGDLATFELRTSALLFQIRRALRGAQDKERAFRQCLACPSLKEAFLAELAAGRALARERVRANPADASALFFLGKLDLNYIWLEVGTIGRRTGWDEYWEARRSLDAVLRLDPAHVRARVAKAWIEYVVSTRMTRGFRWILGGGNKKRALTTVREAATSDADRFAKAEAAFALWEMELQENNLGEALAAARGLARDYPDNEDLRKFIAKNE
jgi:hypothetical protein